MKKYILLASFAFAGMLSAQVKVSGNILSGGADGSTAFLDASSSSSNNATVDIGKGLVFPQVNLKELTSLKARGRTGVSSNFPTNMDGMIVYNIGEGEPAAIGGGENLKRGFYYYENKSNNLQGGKWVRIGGDTATPTTGTFWSIDGNGNTTPVTTLDMKDLSNSDPKLRDYSFNPTGKSFIGTTDDKTVTIATGKENPTDEYKSIARLTIGKIPERTVEGNKFNFVMEVYGKAHFEDGIITKASTYPDYVFDNYFTGKSEENPNYEFKKLNEVEDFIKENNHLPGVTSIKELTKSENGYNVDNTQLSIQTLEKVEELYLHVIEQQKEIQALKAELAELKK